MSYLPCAPGASQSKQLAAHKLRPYQFDFSTVQWRPAVDTRPPTVNRLTLVTYNLWFDQHKRQERIAAVLRVVRDCSPDIIGFQEVTHAHLQRILAEDWIRRNYQISDAAGITLRPHGVLLLSRLPIRSLCLSRLPSNKDRKLVIGELATTHGTLAVGSTHLESSPPNLPIRLEQLDQILPRLRKAQHAVLMGDFNFDPQDRTEQSCLDPKFLDLWPALHGGKPGFTVDSARNRMRLVHKPRYKRTRYDRILLRSGVPGWMPESVRIIGTRPITPDETEVYPSDHFGLAGVITRTQLDCTSQSRRGRA